jgi:CspA family cold shock protein
LSQYRVRPDREFFDVDFKLAEKLTGPLLFDGGHLSRRRGIVKWYSSDMGYGFIENDSGDLFLHSSQINESQERYFQQGAEVDFDVSKGAKGPYARNVRPVGAANS